MRIAAVAFVTATLSFLQAPQSDPPVFRSGVSLVRLDVRVVDGAGQPILDLRQNEIEVIEGDTGRPVLLFQKVAGGGRAYVEMAQRTIASDVSTNQGAPQGQLYVLVFDQDHIRSGGELPVRLAAEAFLRTSVRPQDRVAIFGLPGPGPAQPFTANLGFARQQLDRLRGGLVRRANGAVTEMTESDAYEILRGNDMVLNRYTTVESSNVSTTSGGASSDVSRRASEDPAVLRRLIRENAQSIAMRADAESRHFLQAFADLLRGFRGIDGRKTVLLFSEGFYGDNVARDLEEVAAAAAETYATIYAFDLNKRGSVIDASAPSNDDTSDIASRLEPLGGLAAETSGELLRDASVRLDAALASLSPDDGSYYLVGFEPATRAAGDSTYRRVKIRVRRPGARVLARTGYALADASQPAPTDRRRAIDTALAAPFTQQSLKIEYTTYVGLAAAAGAQRVVLSLHAELPVRRAAAPDGRDARDVADAVFVVRDTRTGRTVQSGSGEIGLPDRTEGGASMGLAPWHVAFDLPAGDYIMRCVVREPGGLVGSADRRFTVRALNGFDVAPTDFVIASPGDRLPVRARAYTEGPLTATLRVYGPTADHLQPGTARLELAPAWEVTETTFGRVAEGVLGEVLTSGTRAMRDVLFTVPLEHLAPGPYVARAIVRIKGEIVADLRRPVDLVVGRAPSATASSDLAKPRNVLDGDIARRLIQQAESAGTEDAAGRLKGFAELRRENYGTAAALLGVSFDANPKDAALAFVLGWAWIGAGNRTAAVTAFRNAVLLEPSMVPAHLALAENYVALGHPDLARQALEAGLGAVPQSLELARMLAALKK
jgi:VWFA-related protein